MPIDIGHLRSWIGREEVAEDVITPVPVAALAATLDRDDPKPRPGDELPPLWHWLYFLPVARQSELGPDGHPKRGGFLPPVSLPRRMWAGARFEFHQPLRIGEPIIRKSTIAAVSMKEGHSGLVVRGRLIATWWADLRRRNSSAALKSFRFRAVSPLFDASPFSVCGTPDPDGRASLWAQSADGHLAMKAEAVMQST